MNADEYARRCLMRLAPTTLTPSDEAVWEAWVDMLRACREYVPVGAGITDNALWWCQSQLGYLERQYKRIGKPPPADEYAKLKQDVEDCHARRELWAAFCAYFDAIGQVETEMAKAALEDMLLRNNDQMHYFNISLGAYNLNGKPAPVEYTRFQDLLARWHEAHPALLDEPEPPP